MDHFEAIPSGHITTLQLLNKGRGGDLVAEAAHNKLHAVLRIPFELKLKLTKGRLATFASLFTIVG